MQEKRQQQPQTNNNNKSESAFSMNLYACECVYRVLCMRFCKWLYRFGFKFQRCFAFLRLHLREKKIEEKKPTDEHEKTAIIIIFLFAFIYFSFFLLNIEKRRKWSQSDRIMWALIQIFKIMITQSC